MPSGPIRDRPGIDGEGVKPARPRVLLVDDDPVGRKLSEIHLRNAGFAVDTASTGEEALVIAAGSPPDAILSDIRMPGMDGFQLCATISRDVRLARIPVVLLSATVVEGPDQRRAADLGKKCVLRTADLREAIEALAAELRRPHDVSGSGSSVK